MNETKLHGFKVMILGKNEYAIRAENFEEVMN